MALENGLSAAIMNPYSVEMLKTYYAFKALAGKDRNCAEYISVADSLVSVSKVVSEGNTTVSGESDSVLQQAIIKGFKEKAGELTKELLKLSDSFDIINREIIPALNIVGEGFEKKTVYLPQLLMSAEAAKSAFEVIKANAETSESTDSGSVFVLATVHGDIHDIGKNIVKLLLQNYGFNVVDLGKDVPPEVIVEKTVELHAPLVGLSALMTTTVPAMEETIKALRNAAPWCKIVVGGAVLTPEYAKKIGADKYAKDAMEAVRYAEEVIKNN